MEPAYITYGVNNTWTYHNGCVLRDNLTLNEATKKVQEFNKNPGRHMDFWYKNNQCLGLDVPYNTELEKTYKSGQKFQYKHYILMLVSTYTNRGTLIIIGSTSDVLSRYLGKTWSTGTFPIQDSNMITRAELQSMCSTTNLNDLKEID